MQIGIESNRSKLESGSAERARSEFKVVVVYEEIYMGLQGKVIFDMIAREAGGEAARLTVWRFDNIGSTALNRTATRQAEEADVIIIAPRNPDTLPPQVLDWVEKWSTKRTPGNGALVTLLDARKAATGRPSGVAMLLWRAAQRAGMNYCFCKVPVVAKPAAETAYPAVSMTRLFPKIQQVRTAEDCGIHGVTSPKR